MKHLITTILATLCCFATVNAASYDFEKVTLFGEGDDKGKLIITIVGDGFTQSQMGTVDGAFTQGDITCDFLPRAKAVANLIMGKVPFSTIKDHIKIYAINVWTTNGSSFFEVTKGSIGGATQYPSTNGVQKLKDLVAQYAPTTASSVIMTKTQVGGDVARPAEKIACCFYTSIVIHELGHALANLADEDARTTNLFERPDLTQTSDTTKVRWKNFVGIAGITVKQKGTDAAATWYVPGVRDLMGAGTNFHIVNQAALIEATARLNMKVPFYGTLFNGIRTNGDFVSIPLDTQTHIKYPAEYGFILDFAFHGCDKLQTLTIPEDVAKIGKYAFLKCTGLKSIIDSATTPQTIDETTFYGVTRSNITLTVPKGAGAAYVSAGWTGFKIVESGNDNPIEYFEILFNSKGGSAIPKQNVVSGSLITEPSPAPTRTGYDFEGWYKEETYLTKWNFATDTVAANITLYAKWKTLSDIEDNIETAQTLTIYPNPVTNGQLTIIARHSREGGNPLEIYDMNGKRVYMVPVGALHATPLPASNQITINVSHLPAGTYIVKIGNRSTKFVKQ